MKEKLARMQALIDLLNQASRAYYQESREIMPNQRYDALYDELTALEAETGVVMANSPTVNVGYEVVSDLPKEAHPTKMLSLDKTKEPEALVAWLGAQKGVMSWKLDGLTIVLTYAEGKLQKAVTRGNGEIGEVVTPNVRTFVNVPLSISFRGRLTLRGEAVISYRDFETINARITDRDAKYKNPRNLCAGSVRQLNSEITAKRHVRFFAFALVEAEGMTFATRTAQFDWLAGQGFSVVEHRMVDGETLQDTIAWFSEQITQNEIPSDGLVLSYEDIAYGKALGTTAKFPRDSIAFKWADEEKETTLQEIEWSASRTGLINPVAIFDPVELEGTTVSRASVHNLSVMKELQLGIGDQIKVYKANMIIPQISENLTKSGRMKIPHCCPVCGGDTTIHNENGVETLLCPNPACLAKQIKSLTLFVSREAMDIEGLSEMTLEKLVDRGMVRELADLFRLKRYQAEITQMEGFGEKSFANLLASTEKARHVTTAKLLYSLGIPGIGTANARLIAQHCENRWETVVALTTAELLTIDGIGEVMAEAFVNWFADEEHRRILADLLTEITIDETYTAAGSVFSGLTFVITGSLQYYENRNALKHEIEQAGGKVAGSVSAKTSYLINNDRTSGSSKNKKANELGIRIIDEETVRGWLAAGEIKEENEDEDE